MGKDDVRDYFTDLHVHKEKRCEGLLHGHVSKEGEEVRGYFTDMWAGKKMRGAATL